MSLHRNLTGNDMHVAHAFTYPDEASRNSATGFTSADVGKIALQSDNKSFWVLTATTPTWIELTNTTPHPIFNYLIVGKSGTVNFNSIGDAVAFAVANGASLLNRWVVHVYPGTYVENNPIVIPAGVIVESISGESISAVNVMPSNPLDDLIQLTGNSGLIGLRLSGVSDPLKALIRSSGSGLLNSIENCIFLNCSNGIIISGGNVCGILSSFFSVPGPGIPIETGIIVDGINSKLYFRDSGTIVLPSILSSYPGSEPLNTTIKITNGAVGEIQNCTFQHASNKISATDIFIDGYKTSTSILGSTFRDGYIGIHMESGADMADTTFQACSIFGYTKNIIIDSATAVMFHQSTIDDIKLDLINPSVMNGVRSVTSLGSTQLLGHIDYVFNDSLRTLNVNQFLRDQISTGLTSGGVVTHTTGLNVHVADGYGWVKRDIENDAVDVSWTAATFTLIANTTNFIFYSGSSLTLTSSIVIPSTSDILLATIYTDGSTVRFLHNTSTFVNNTAVTLYNYLLSADAFTLKNGLATSQGSSATKITVDPGTYYKSNTPLTVSGAADATFSYFYNNGATEVASQTNLDILQYDNAGTLTTMTDGYFRSDTVYITSDNRISIIYGTAQFPSASDASQAAIAPPPSFIEPTGFAIAKIVIAKNVGINTIIDTRTRENLGAGVGTGGGVTVHGLLSGLLADDHPQYLLVSGTRNMSGNLNLGTHDVVNVGLVDGVDVSTHAARHNPGGLDALATGTPVTILVGATADAGAAASYAKSDHQHGIGAGTPLTISTANSAGTASTVARSDHVHAHGALGGGSTHALVVADPGGTAGFMSSADKQKLDGIQSGATNSPLTSIAPVNVTRTTAAVGVSTEAARQDHKHDVSVGTPVSIGTANSAGSATTLVLSDHVHAHGSLPGGATHALVTPDPGGTAGYMSSADKQKLDGIQSGATNSPLTNTAPVNVTKATAAVGISTEAARQDHKHDVSTAAAGTINIGDAAAEGTATTLARSDHTHALTAPSAPVNVNATAASAGTATTVARSDHKHNIDTGIPVAVGITNSAGTATTLSLSDHVHRGTTLQSTFTEISADTTTTSLTFVDLLTQSITTTGGNLIIQFTASASNSNAGKLVDFRITVDGTAKRGAQVNVGAAGQAESCAITIKVTGLSASTHTVKVQWLTNANTAQIRPVTAPDTEHASLLITEITV